jgi:homoserine kinase type II
MALLTPLDLIAAQQLVTPFGIELSLVEALVLGSVNSNFRLTDVRGRTYFARIYEEQGSEGAALEAALLAGLAARGLPVAAPLNASVPTMVEYQGKPFTVFPWVAGQDLCHAQIVPDHCYQIGAALAQVHLASPVLPRLSAGRFDLKSVQGRLDLIEQSTDAYRAPVAQIRVGLNRYVEEQQASAPLPSGVIHGDLFRDNVLWSSGRISALLDFESASNGCFIFDLMVTLLAWCYRDSFDQARVSAMLRGYESERPLSSEERRLAPNEASLACLRFATTRITDFAMRTQPGAEPKRKYQRFLERLEAVRAGALDFALEG